MTVSLTTAEQIINQHIRSGHWQRLNDFIQDRPKPLLIIELNAVKKNYLQLQKLFGGVQIFYSVKANPVKEVLAVLNELGASFEVASVYELERLLELKVDPKKISFSNTVKKASDIDYAHQKGVDLFACDSYEELQKIARFAAGAKVCFRLATEGTGSNWPLSKKFGSHPDAIYHLILKSVDLDVIPFGLSFHVGSQQQDVGQWDNAIAHCQYLFQALSKKKIALQMINIGGGLPCDYLEATLSLADYAKEIMRYLKEDFSDNMPKIYVEPGRALVGNAGVIVSEVLLKTKKSHSDIHSWLYVDVGIFNGLMETLGEAIKYPIWTERSSSSSARKNMSKMILAGPTCDSTDILYEKFKYELPATLQSGDLVYFLSTGAYTYSYSSTEFNGFPPLSFYCI